tara:strand:- start:21 stop:185 length:165 start_codon:yes stop_codon:yes gene_type:complete
MTLKLSKKEREFLIDWLEDDVILASEDPQNYSNYVFKMLQTITTKIKKEKENGK